MNAKVMRNQKGFHHIALLLIIVIVAVVGLAGYRVLKASDQKTFIYKNSGSDRSSQR